MASFETAIVLPPNKQMDVDFDFSDKPVVYEHLFFLDFSKEGRCIVGSSDITGTFWEGTLMYFNEEKCLEDFTYSKYYVHMTASDGKFIDEETIAVAEDTGVLNILTLDDSSTLKPMNFFRHIRKIPQIAVWDKSVNVLTCSGSTANIWNANSSEKRPSFTSRNIHMDDINSVDTFKSEPSKFVSASSDRKALLWDIRAESLPLELYNNEFASLTQIAVHQTAAQSVAVGTEAGDIYWIDTRKPGDFVSTFHCFDGTVNSLSFNLQGQLGVCGDINEVVVINCLGDNLEELHRNKMHIGHVKALKWYDNNLYSCGFGDAKVIKHVLGKVE